jgi:hypothetical protein
MKPLVVEGFDTHEMSQHAVRQQESLRRRGTITIDRT